MKGRLTNRLDRLVQAAKPGRCQWVGDRCVQHAVVGGGSTDQPEPALPELCAGCGRPISWRFVRLVGIDVDRL